MSGGSTVSMSSAVSARLAGARRGPGFTLPDPLRRKIRALWRTCPYPADPASFADFLHQIAVGRLDPDRPPWVFHQQTQARITANPATFDEAFRQIGRKSVGGGPKTTPADELLFCGNIGSGIIFLTSRVRLIDPNESFYTSSNHRLRDSHVGRAGHGSISRYAGIAPKWIFLDPAARAGGRHASRHRPPRQSALRTGLNRGWRPGGRKDAMTSFRLCASAQPYMLSFMNLTPQGVRGRYPRPDHSRCAGRREEEEGRDFVTG